MKTLFRVGCLGCCALLGLVSLPALRAADSGNRPVGLSDNLEAVVPAQLKTLLMENPAVTFLITVSDEGKLVDHLAVSATHHELLPRAEETLRRATFTPAMANGKPVQATGEVTVRFYDPDQRAYHDGLLSLPLGGTSMDGANRRIYEVSKARFVYRRAKPSELDQPVELRETKVMVLTDAKGQPAAGDCVVEYFVDARGEVHAPRVVTADNDTVALSALLTLQNTRYAPVTRDGMPAYVKVRQPMSYGPSTPAETKPLEK